MRRVLSMTILILVFIPACTSENIQLDTTTQPAPPVTERPPATELPTPLPTLDPSIAPVSQFIDDLAGRLGIPKEQIAVQGLRPVVWQAESLRCPPPPDPTFPLEYVMIVTEDGTRYELPSERNKPGKDTAMAIVFLVGETSYSYYVVGDQFLFCPDEQ